MVFEPYIVYPTSLSLLISSSSVCHHSSGISTLLNVGHCFFQASKGQPNTITWDLCQPIESGVIGLFSLFQFYIGNVLCPFIQNSPTHALLLCQSMLPSLEHLILFHL